MTELYLHNGNYDWPVPVNRADLYLYNGKYDSPVPVQQ